jgi:hypothetical protein
MDQVTIQYQTSQGVWINVQHTFNESVSILSVVRSVQNAYPNCRIRAVDSSGRVVDIFN